MERIKFDFTSLFWYHGSKQGFIITVINFNSPTLEGWKTLKGLQFWWTSVWKNKHRIYVRNDDSSGFSEQRKSIEPEFDQRSFPRGHKYNGKQKFEKDFYVWMLFLLSYTPDKHLLYSTIALYNKMNHTSFWWVLTYVQLEDRLLVGVTIISI